MTSSAPTPPPPSSPAAPAAFDTLVIERRLSAPPGRVFQAFADPDERRRWDVPGDGWTLLEHRQDFRVDGIEMQRFGPEGGPVLHSTGRYLNIVPGQRIVSAGVMHSDGVPMTATLFTALFEADAGGTRLRLVDQSQFFGDERPEHRRAGWNEILDKLEGWLADRPQDVPARPSPPDIH